MSTPITSINNLDWRKFKSCNYGGIEDNEGYNQWTTEAGFLSNIIRWRDHKFTLVLHNLDRDQLFDICIELLEAEQNNYRALIYKDKIDRLGYIDFKGVLGDPPFIFQCKDVRISRHNNSDQWMLTIQLMERVVL